MTNICSNCVRDYARRNFANIKAAQPWECLYLYKVPLAAEQKMQVIEQDVGAKRCCFRVIAGEHGEGKTAMLRYIERRIAEQYNVCYTSILYSPDWIESQTRFYTGLHGAFFSNFTFPDGTKLLDRLAAQPFRRQLAHALYPEGYMDIELAAIWRDYTLALYHSASDDDRLRALAITYLSAQDISDSASRKDLDLSKKNIRLTNPMPILNLLKVYTLLSQRLGYNGFLITFDELEQLGFLGRATGERLLTQHRDFVNLLTTDTVLREGGCHIFYSVSTWYLQESGLWDQAIPTAGVRVSTRKPKVMLGQIDRFERIINPGNTVYTRLEQEEMADVLNRVIACRKVAYPDQAARIHQTSDALLDEAMAQTSTLIPGRIFQTACDLLTNA